MGSVKEPVVGEWKHLPKTTSPISSLRGGPQNLGDPFDRALSKREYDTLIPQRMREEAHGLCVEAGKPLEQCSRESGLLNLLKCSKEKKVYLDCLAKWFNSDIFKDQMIEEYLNERSHYRNTGIRTQRFRQGKYVFREDDALDGNGKYRPRKPEGWDETYGRGMPKWAKDIYK